MWKECDYVTGPSCTQVPTSGPVGSRLDNEKQKCYCGRYKHVHPWPAVTPMCACRCCLLRPPWPSTRPPYVTSVAWRPPRPTTLSPRDTSSSQPRMLPTAQPTSSEPSRCVRLLLRQFLAELLLSYKCDIVQQSCKLIFRFKGTWDVICQRYMSMSFVEISSVVLSL